MEESYQKEDCCVAFGTSLAGWLYPTSINITPNIITLLQQEWKHHIGCLDVFRTFGTTKKVMTKLISWMIIAPVKLLYSPTWNASSPRCRFDHHRPTAERSMLGGK
jgi:hypothetical protein